MPIPLRPPLAALALALAGCAHGPPPAPTPASLAVTGAVAEGTLEGEDILKARARGGAQPFQWEAWSKEAFDRARAEHRLILVDGAAEWCHWCHVMDETTYRDPEVGRVLRERFVAIRLDVDERPDLGDRYADWGWPATILLSPDAEELGKFRGYLPPERLLEILRGLDAGAATPGPAAKEEPRRPGAPVAALPWIAARATRDMDRGYDKDQGSWGSRRKTPLAMNLLFELRRAAHGDAAALSRARGTLERQRAILDPVWGGLYQYSAAPHWKAPHFEKLMAVQAPSIEAYARGYAATGDPALRDDALLLARYVGTLLSAPDGTFYPNQDADLNAHNPAGKFVDGHVYYALDDAGRRALGVPWVDPHVYALPNGLAIQALCALHEVTRDAATLDRARRAAGVLARTHLTEEGAVRREAASRTGPWYLADAAGLGLGLARLAAATGEAVYREQALRIGKHLVATLRDDATGAYWDHTADPSGAGVFARRRQSFVPNVATARFLAALGRLTGDEAWTDLGRRALAGIASPPALDGEGLWLGDFLLAVDDLGLYPW